jgi:hypothetical protein
MYFGRDEDLDRIYGINRIESSRVPEARGMVAGGDATGKPKQKSPEPRRGDRTRLCVGRYEFVVACVSPSQRRPLSGAAAPQFILSSCRDVVIRQTIRFPSIQFR